MMKQFFKFLLLTAFALIIPVVVLGKPTPRHIKVDQSLLSAMQQRITAVNAKGVPVANYYLTKAQCWLDFAAEEYDENDRTGIVGKTYAEAAALVRQLEDGSRNISMETSLVGCSRLRPDLWKIAEDAKLNSSFGVVAGKIAQLEVTLVTAGHEKDELGWRHARASLAEAEALAAEIQADLQAVEAAHPVEATVAKIPSVPVSTPPPPVEPIPVSNPPPPVVIPATQVENPADAPGVKTTPEKPALLPPPSPAPVVTTLPPAPVITTPPPAPVVTTPPAPVAIKVTVKPAIKPEHKALSLPAAIHFAFDQATIGSRSMPILLQLASAMRKYPEMRVHLIGVTDRRGSVGYNIALGMSRARAARAFLVHLGITESRITIESIGKTRAVTMDAHANALARVVNLYYFLPGMQVNRVESENDLQPDH